MTKSDQILTNILNHVAKRDPRFAATFFRRQPKYRYFPVKGSQDQPFWTVETVQHNGKQRYASGIYKHIKTKNQMKLTRPRYHSKRKDAKDRAMKLWKELSK